MSKWNGSLRAALAAGCALALMGGCGDGESGSRADDKVPLPSVAREPAELASVAPAPKPVVAAVTPVAPVDRKDAPIVERDEPEETKPVIGPALDFEGHMAEGKKRYNAGEFRDALRHFEQAAIIKPRDGGARVQLSRALLVLGDKREARRYVEQALELAPSSSAAWSTLGRIELAEQDLEAAVASFRRATEENDEDAFAWNNLGYTLMALGRYDEAIDALEHATAGEKPTEYMWNNLGMAYEHVDRIREARAAYRQAASFGSKKGEANMIRLDGVRSLKRSTDEDGDQTADATLVTP